MTDNSCNKSIWDTLKSCNIDHDYISLLKKIYRDHKASVQTDEESNIFEIRKGTKQGDPQSSLLFNTVLQYSLKDEIQRWQKKKRMGKNLIDHDHDCLTNLRLADDVMLFATSKEQIRKMLCEFKKVSEKMCLRIPPEKTKIPSNQSTINWDTKKKQLEVDDMNIEILTRNESVKYLGQKISFYQQEATEIKSRIRAAWATLHKYRPELTSKNYMLKHRLRLFDATVSPTVCYAAGTWAPNKEHERIIQSTQRKMLRLVIQTKRKYKKIEKQDIGTKEENEEIDINEMCSTDDESGDGQSTTTHNDVDSEVSFEDDADDEIDTTLIEEADWIEYIKRSTEDAMEKMECAKIRCWNRTHKMKWKMALRIATSPSERWLKKAAEWNAELSSRCRTNRAIGRPRKRWEDNINGFLKQKFEENENPVESSNQNQQNLDQHSQRPQKMGSSRRNLHNDCVRTTEV